jgi:hypothetical protein
MICTSCVKKNLYLAILDISYRTSVYLLHHNRIVESTEQEEYSAVQEHRELGQV